MTGGLDLAVSTAAPTPPVGSPVVAVPTMIVIDAPRVPLPPSPAFSPITPPPHVVG